MGDRDLPTAPATDPAAAVTVSDPGGARSTHLGAGFLTRGSALGRYIVLERLGKGGMGVVHSAYDPELDRKVAVKLLRPEASDKLTASEGRARLLREAQAMARLAHPNVIAVHDVGTFQDRVFVAMEFVDGPTLTQWCQAKPRSWREVLDVLMQAGRGLAAAHSAGLVHRDFKPDNVLLGRDGRVRVLDFGLARAAGALAPSEPSAEPAAEESGQSNPKTLSTPLTRTGAIMGTPAYMAPEQHLAQPADARTDQFSFCVALYEALYGERPFRAGSLHELATEILQGNVRPPPKDTRVPLWVRRAVLRGLRVKPEERYPTLEALLADLARDPGTRRRRVLGGALVVGLAGLAVFGTVRSRREQGLLCRGAERKLSGVWDDARKQTIHAAFLATGKPFAEDAFRAVAHGLDQYAAAWTAQHTEACESTRVRGEQSEELLDLRMQCLDARREEVRALVDLFSHGDAQLVQRAAQAVPSAPSLGECEHAEALRQVVRTPQDAGARTQVQTLRTRLAEGAALRRAGRYKDGRALAESTLAKARALHYAPLEAEALHLLAILETDGGDARTAETTLLRAVAAAEVGRHDLARARALVELVHVLGGPLARYDEAQRYVPLAEAALERAGGDELLRSKLLEYQTFVREGQGKFEQALDTQKRVLEIRERTLGPRHIDVAVALLNLGEEQRQLGRYEDAIGSYQRARAIWEPELGAQHPRVALALNNIGTATLQKGDFATAVPFFEQALAIREGALGPDHPDVSMTLNNLGTTLTELGEYERAAPLLERALAIKEKVMGPQHPSVAIALWARANLELLRGRPAQALPWAQRALAIREHGQAPDHPQLAESLIQMADIEVGLHAPAQAIPLAQRAIAMVEHREGGAIELAQGRFSLARALWDAGRDRAHAHELAAQARAAFLNAGGPQGKKAVAEVDAWTRSHRQ